MQSKNFVQTVVFCALILLLNSGSLAQRKTPAKITVKSKPVIFAVIEDGARVEPIAVLEKGKLAAPAVGEDKELQSFNRNYYKPKTAYDLIFGGAVSGSVAIVGSDPNAECSKSAANVTVQSVKAKLKGFVMGLATSQGIGKKVVGLRRLPTPAERAEIEALVRAELIKQKVSVDTVGNLKYYNLTALDLDSDGQAEMVGSFYTDSLAKERNELFFIAEKAAGGKYKFGHSAYEKITSNDVMSGDLKDLDQLGGELLLDTLNYDGDKTAEVFTVDKGFEGYNYNVYSRQNGKWTKVFENSIYHCAY